MAENGGGSEVGRWCVPDCCCGPVEADEAAGPPCVEGGIKVEEEAPIIMEGGIKAEEEAPIASTQYEHGVPDEASGRTASVVQV